jgi:hypothetical protein
MYLYGPEERSFREISNLTAKRASAFTVEDSRQFQNIMAKVSSPSLTVSWDFLAENLPPKSADVVRCIILRSRSQRIRDLKRSLKYSMTG